MRSGHAAADSGPSPRWRASLGSQVLSYRRSFGGRRQQLKWLLTGSAITGVCDDGHMTPKPRE
jgi:hypothetical protein